jgi:putative membrane protein
MTGPQRKPTAFRIDDDGVAVVEGGAAPPAGARIVVEPERETFDAPVLVPPPRRKGLRWGRVFWGALAGLISLAVGIEIDALISSLTARADWLGWLGLGLAGLALTAAVAITVREVAGVLRLSRMDDLRRAADLAAAKDDATDAAVVVRDLVAFYRNRPETAAGRAAIAGHLREVIDGRDLLALAEADILSPLDAAARRLVSDAAKRVSVVTAVSPRAIIDIGFVLVAVLGLIRKLADLYGGRPGLIGFLSLTRHVLSHLAVTGGMAIGDGLVQQIVGHGVAARLSARLGEGVVNGMLTARVGLAAIDVCRPMPFIGQTRPGISDVMSGIVSRGDKGEA